MIAKKAWSQCGNLSAMETLMIEVENKMQLKEHPMQRRLKNSHGCNVGECPKGNSDVDATP